MTTEKTVCLVNGLTSKLSMEMRNIFTEHDDFSALAFRNVLLCDFQSISLFRDLEDFGEAAGVHVAQCND